MSGAGAAAVGMMLYAGIRPHEVARLSWDQVDLQERAIYILPRHSFRRRSCGDIVRRFTGGVSFPMDWETKIQRFTGNEIRFADEIHHWWTISPPQAGTISAPAERTGDEEG